MTTVPSNSKTLTAIRPTDLRDIPGKTLIEERFSQSPESNKVVDVKLTNSINDRMVNGTVAAGHASSVKLTMDHEMDIMNPDNKDKTRLYYAASRGQVELVNLLLSKSADISGRDELGWTPLHYAASEGQIEIVEILLGKGADISSQDKTGNRPLWFAAA
jgi:ankyrin repeat protein